MKKILYGFYIVALLHSGFSSVSQAQETGQQKDIEQNVNEMLNLFDEMQNDEAMSKELSRLKDGGNKAEEPDPLEHFVAPDENLGSTEKDNAKNSIETANEVVRFDADTPESHFQLGLEYWLAKNYDEAIHQFQEVVRMDPVNAHAYWNLGLLYDEKNQGPQAIANIKKAKAIYTKYEYSTYEEEAIKRLNSYLEKYGDSSMRMPAPE